MTKEWAVTHVEQLRAIKRKWNRNNAEYYRQWRAKNRNRLRQKIAGNKMFIKTHLESHPCVDCGESDIRCLDFDHVNGKKKYSIGNMRNNVFSLNTIKTEMDKCEIRCSNCHRKKHYIDKNGAAII